MENFEKLDIPLFPISVAARILDISVHTLRMYEREGLIIPFKKESSHRLYSKSDIDRLSCIRSAINDSKISINGIKTIYSLIPCWDITECTEADRANCEAYQSHTNPCWTYNHKKNVCANSDCRVCHVYTEFAECKKVKEGIKNISRKK